MKFLKNGKVVSHFAKAYRGSVLRNIAIKKPLTQEAFLQIPFEGLEIVEIRLNKLKSEYIYKILD